MPTRCVAKLLARQPACAVVEPVVLVQLACGMLRKAIRVRKRPAELHNDLAARAHEQEWQDNAAAAVATTEGQTSEDVAWVQLLDPATDMPYYYNQLTQAVQWEPPATFGDAHYYVGGLACMLHHCVHTTMLNVVSTGGECNRA